MGSGWKLDAQDKIEDPFLLNTEKNDLQKNKN